MKKPFRTLSLLFVTTFLFILLNGINFSQTPQILTNGLQIEQPAAAKSSGSSGAHSHYYLYDSSTSSDGNPPNFLLSFVFGFVVMVISFGLGAIILLINDRK